METTPTAQRPLGITSTTVAGPTPPSTKLASVGHHPTRTGLLDHLMREGHDRDAILSTGLFTEDLRPLWQGRYVLPYFDSDDNPVYAISRSTGSEGGGAVGYDGHPADGLSGKYAKPAHTKPYAHVEEPIFGLGCVEDGQPVLITERLAAFDLVRWTDAGWRFALPFHTDEERGKTIHPWFVAPSETDREQDTLIREAIAEAIYDLLDAERYADTDDPVGGALFAKPGERIPALREAWEWLGPWISAVEILVNAGSSRGLAADDHAPCRTNSIAVVGVETDQASIVAAAGERK